MSKAKDFDPATVVKTYRNVILERDTTRNKKHRRELGAAAKGLRKFWKDWQGDDDLHETPFGEPVE